MTWSGKIRKTWRERFAAFTDTTGGWEPPVCHPWRGSRTTNAQPYGKFGRHVAHRVAYEIAYGPIPSGHDVDHICRNRLCVRARHLEAVTRSENRRRTRRPKTLTGEAIDRDPQQKVFRDDD